MSFPEKVYRRVHGTVMESPVFVVISNLVMKDIEERALTAFHSPPRFWKHYVDDTCTALPRDMVKTFHSHLNSIELCTVTCALAYYPILFPIEEIFLYSLQQECQLS